VKLRGIVDSKQASPAPASPHSPQPQPDGTVACCGRRYARHAHLAHLRGERITEWQSDVGVVAADQVTEISEMARARLYAEQAQRDRQTAQRVDGADESIYGF